MAHVSSLAQYDRFHTSWIISRFFAHDFDYQSLSLRISGGGVLPRRTKDPFTQEAKKKKKQKQKQKQKQNGETQAHDDVGHEAVTSETTKTEPLPVSKLEAQEHEKELRSNPEAQGSIQEHVERLEHAVEPSEAVDVPEEDATEVGSPCPSANRTLTGFPKVVEVVQKEDVQETLETAQALQDEEDLGGKLTHHRDVHINRDPQSWVQASFLVVDPFIGTKVSSCGRFWAVPFKSWNAELHFCEQNGGENIQCRMSKSTRHSRCGSRCQRDYIGNSSGCKGEKPREESREKKRQKEQRKGCSSSSPAQSHEAATTASDSHVQCRKTAGKWGIKPITRPCT